MKSAFCSVALLGLAWASAGAFDSNAAVVALSEQHAARFVLPRAPHQAHYQLKVVLALNDDHIIVPTLSLRVLGRQSNMHKLQACVATPYTWGEEQVTGCSVPVADHEYHLNLEQAARLWCSLPEFEQQGGLQ